MEGGPHPAAELLDVGERAPPGLGEDVPERTLIGLDLGVVAAMASSFLDRPVDPKTVIVGEVGLTGEVRAVSQMETRVKEASRLGFNRCILPKTNMVSLNRTTKMEISAIRSLKDLLENLF